MFVLFIDIMIVVYMFINKMILNSLTESPIDSAGNTHAALGQSALSLSDDNSSSLSDLSPEDAILEYQKQTIDKDLPKQHFNVCRVDGRGELGRDIIGIYKKPDLKSCAILKVRFEEEDGVGNGPIREFLVLAVQVADEGIPSTSGRSKPLLLFEGQPDHRLPVHDQSFGTNNRSQHPTWGSWSLWIIDSNKACFVI